MPSMVDKETEDFFESALRDIDKIVEGSRVPNSNGTNDKVKSSTGSTVPSSGTTNSNNNDVLLVQQLSSCGSEVARVRGLLRSMPRENQRLLWQALSLEWAPLTPSTAASSPGSPPVSPNSESLTETKLQSVSEECQTLRSQITILKAELDTQQERNRLLSEMKDGSFGLDERLRYLNTINRQQKKLNAEELEKKELFMALNQAREEIAQLKQISAKQMIRISALEHIIGMSPERAGGGGRSDAVGFTTNPTVPLVYVRPPTIPEGNFPTEGGVSNAKSTSLDELHCGGNNYPSQTPLTIVPEKQVEIVKGRSNSTSTDPATPNMGRPLFMPTMTPPMRPRHTHIVPQANLQQQLGGSYLQHNYLSQQNTTNQQNYWPGSAGAGLQQVSNASNLFIPNAMNSKVSGSDFAVGGGRLPRHYAHNNVNVPEKGLTGGSSQVMYPEVQSGGGNTVGGDARKYGTMPNSVTAPRHEVNPTGRTSLPSAQSEEMLQHNHIPDIHHNYISATQSVSQPPALSEAFRRGGLRATASARLGGSAGPGLTRPLIFSGERADVVAVPVLEEFENFTADHLSAWLHDLQLAMYVPNLRSYVRDGRHMLNINRRELEKHLMMKNVMHVKKVFTHLQQIKLNAKQRLQVAPTFSIRKFLDDLGLLQYLPEFTEASVDAYVFDQLTLDEVVQYLRVSNELHVVSLRRGVQLMRHIGYDLARMKRRPSGNTASPSDNNNHSGKTETNSEFVAPSSLSGGAPGTGDGVENLDMEHLSRVALWSHHHVVDWLRTANFPEFAANLRASGVHGALMVLEPRFTAHLLAAVLNIGEERSLLRRHLIAEFTKLLGQPLLQWKENTCGKLALNPLTVTAKVKRKRHLFYSGSSSKSKNSLDGDLLCPQDVDSVSPCNLAKLLVIPLNEANHYSPEPEATNGILQETAIDDD